MKRKPLKKIIFIFLSITVIFMLQIYFQSNKTYEVLKRSDTGKVIYQMLGEKKAVYSYDKLLGKNEMLFEIGEKYTYVDENIGVYYKEYEENQELSGIYTYINNEEKLILKSYKPIGEILKIGNEILFLCENENKKQICVYNIDSKSLESKEISLLNNEYISIYDVTIKDKNTLIYPKKIVNKETNITSYSLIKYNINDSKEEVICEGLGNIVSPSISPKGNKVAYIKKDKSIYNLYIYDFKSKENKLTDIKGGIVKNSVVWSKNGENLLCVTDENGHQNTLQLFNIKDNTIKKFDNIYNGFFSGENIIASRYNISENIQYIYYINTDTNKKNIIYSFYEKSIYSRGVKIKDYIEI